MLLVIMINKYYLLAKKKLYKLNRSITGRDTLETLKIIRKNFPNLKIKAVKSGTKVFDWNVPKEWNVIEAFIITPSGKKYAISMLITFTF